MRVEVSKSDRADKKYMARFIPSTPTEKVNNKTIHFGSKGSEDFTTHGDVDRKENYIARHKKNENWRRTGIRTAGFWAKHLLWNKPTMEESAKHLKNMGIRVIIK